MSGAGAEQELFVQTSQLHLTMYVCMYAVTLQECNNVNAMQRMRTPWPAAIIAAQFLDEGSLWATMAPSKVELSGAVYGLQRLHRK